MSALVDRIAEVLADSLRERFDDNGHPDLDEFAAHVAERIAEVFDEEPRDWTIPELARLSRLHVAYEEKSDAHKELLPTASELSRAVGRFVAARGFRAAIKDQP